MAGIRMTALIVLTGIGLLAGLAAGKAAVESQVYVKLLASRDALSSQERDIQRAYDEVSRQIDELHTRQQVLDQYLRQTQASLRDIDRAITSTR